MIVLKFGGTSVGDADAILRTTRIVASRRDKAPVVVVSAMSKVTDGLLAIAEQAARGHLIGALRGVETIRDRHLTEAERLLGSAEHDACAELSARCDELAHLAEALCTLGDVTPRSLDAIAAFGEQLSSLLCVATFSAHGLPARHVDGRHVVITDATFTKAEPQPELIAQAARDVLLPVIHQGQIPVMGGFIGSSAESRITTTLGRGGGDYSASLVAAALRADAIEIWTDVDGMLTADPRVVPGTRPIDCIGFDEASELASFGAKVLHPSTVAPAVQMGIPVMILNSRRPEAPGTIITFDAPRRPVTAIAGKSGVALVRVASPRMLQTEGFLEKLFAVFARHRVSVDVVATSEVSVSVTIDEVANISLLLADLRELGDVSVEQKRGIVAIVGAGLSDGATPMARALAALGNMHIYMLSLSATGINLTVVVDAEQVPIAMQRLHAAYFADPAPAVS